MPTCANGCCPRSTDTRVRASAVHRDSIAVRREGAAQIALVGPPNVGKSSLLQALSEIQIKTGDYPFTTLRPVPALTRIGGVLVQLVEIPGLIGGAGGRSRWRPRAARRPAHGRRDRLLLSGGRRSGRARDRPRGRSPRPASTSRPSWPPRAPTRPTTAPSTAWLARVPGPDGRRGLRARRGLARCVPGGRLGADRADPRPAAEGRLRWIRIRSRSNPGPTVAGRRRLGPSRPRRVASAARGCGARRRGSTASASVASTRSVDGDTVEICADLPTGRAAKTGRWVVSRGRLPLTVVGSWPDSPPRSVPD